jgi:hypothetical protein
MLAAMHNPAQMYALATLEMAEAEARARHARMVAGRRPTPLRHVLRMRLQRAGAPRPAAPPLGATPKPAP